MAAVAPRNTRLEEDGWRVFPLSMRPADDLVGHLVFALNDEGVHLLTLKLACATLGPSEREEAAGAKPTSAYIRRLCSSGATVRE